MWEIIIPRIFFIKIFLKYKKNVCDELYVISKCMFDVIIILRNFKKRTEYVPRSTIIIL